MDRQIDTGAQCRRRRRQVSGEWVSEWEGEGAGRECISYLICHERQGNYVKHQLKRTSMDFSSAYNFVSISDCLVLRCKMSGEQRICKNIEGSNRDLFEVTSRHLRWRVWRIPRKQRLGRDCNQSTSPTTSVDRYRCTNLLGQLMDSIRKKLNADAGTDK
jgi:hypothetical protein